jgi:hypothetical protein
MNEYIESYIVDCVLDPKPVYKKHFDNKINSTLSNSEVYFADEIHGYDQSI